MKMDIVNHQRRSQGSVLNFVLPDHECPKPVNSLLIAFGYICVECVPSMKLITVEPRHTTTPLIRPPRYYDHFLMARTKAYSFYYDQRPPFGVPNLYFLYKITPY